MIIMCTKARSLDTNKPAHSFLLGLLGFHLPFHLLFNLCFVKIPTRIPDDSPETNDRTGDTGNHSRYSLRCPVLPPSGTAQLRIGIDGHTITRGNGPQGCPGKSEVLFFPTTLPEVGRPQYSHWSYKTLGAEGFPCSFSGASMNTTARPLLKCQSTYRSA